MRIQRRWLVYGPILGLATAGLVGAGSASASTLTCGAVITQSVSLTADIGPCPADGLVIQGDNVKVDLGHHTVRGAGAQTGSTVGIRVRGSHNVQVSEGTVTGFDAGVAVARGGGNKLVGLTIADNIGNSAGDFCDGVAVLDSPGNTLTGLEVRHNGPCDGIGIFGAASTGNLVKGNTVEDQTVPRQPGGSFSTDFGINLGQGFDTWPSQVTIRGNTVRNNGGDGINACSQFGNPCITTDDSIIGNTVQHNGFYLGADTVAAQFGGDGIRLVSNDFAGTQGFTGRITVKGNTVTQNAADGIFVATRENTIVGNTSLDNNQSRGFFQLDLRDLSSPADHGCDSNVWSGNRWGPYYNALPQFGAVGLTDLGSYDPECTSTNGSGPRPGAFTSFAPASSASGTPAPQPSAQSQVAPPRPSTAQDQIPPMPPRQLSRLEA